MFRYRRTIMSAGVLAVSLFYFIYALLCIESRHVRGVPDSGFIPRIVGGLLVILSVIMTVSDFRRNQREPDEASSTEKKENRNVLGTAVLLLVYICLIEPLGFLIASVLYLFAQFLYLTEVSNLRRPKTYVLYFVIALVVSTGIYYLFLNVFHLILPAGILK
jgi:putative tricarboxylic transport membrane protein